MLQSLKKWYSIVIFCILLIGSSPVHAQDLTEIGFFEPTQVSPGGTIQVPVSVNNAYELYAVDVIIRFDPTKIQVIDADPSVDGVQVGLGSFLDPGLLLFNTVDNQQGTIHFAMSQYNPSEPKSGDGVLLVLNFSGISEGESALTMTDLMCASNEGNEIPSQARNSTLTVVPGAPTQQATYAVVELTQIILISTATPTPLPTATRQPTITPTRQVAPTEVVPTIVSNTPVKEKGQSGFFLVKNWWIILILVIAVLAVGIVFFRNEKRNK